MELSQLRAFVAVSREGTIVKAAQSMGLTASPLSRTIKELERILGGELFVRTYHELVLTPLGEQILPRAVDVVSQADALLDIARGIDRDMRVGITPWASSRFGDRVIETARAANLQVDVESDLSSTLLHHLQHGTLDLAVVHLPVDLPGVSTRPLGMYQFSILTEPDHALANLKSARLVDLADHKLLMLPLMMQPRAMQRVRESLAEAGVVSIVELDLKDVVNVRSRMRRNGEIMLGTLADDTPLARVMPIKDGAVVPLEPGELTLEIGLAWRTDREDRDKTFSALIASVEPAAGKPLEIVR